jgi:hypothetical protein
MIAVPVVMVGVLGYMFFINTGTQPPPVAGGGSEVPAELVRGVLVDPSGSNGGAQEAEQQLARVAQVIQGWPGAEPPDDGSKDYSGKDYPGSPGLNLTVRQVVRDSFGSEAAVATVRIPSVASLGPKPAADDPRLAAFMDEVADVERQYDAAATAALKAADELRSARLKSEVSEVAGGLSALTQVMPPSNQPRGIVVISDVEQRGAQPEVSGDLSNIAVTVFQRCDEGAERCEVAKRQFIDLAEELNGAAPEFLRVETLSVNLADVLRGEGG